MLRFEKQIEFGCSLGDIPCIFIEQQARSFADFLTWLADTVIGQQDLAPGSSLWDNALVEAGYWMPFALLVMLTTAAIGIGRASLTMSKQEMGWVAICTALAIPTTYFALTLGGQLLRLADEISDGILERIGGSEGLINLTRAIAQGGTGNNIAGTVIQVTGGVGTFVMLALVGVGLMLMGAAIAFRNFAVMVLIAFSPLAFMAFPMKGGETITRKWAAAGIAMIVAKPLMLGVLAMVLRGMKDISLFSGEAITLGIGLIVVTFMPFLAYSFFNFMGAARAMDAGEHAGGAFGNKMGNTARTIGRSAKGAAGNLGRTLNRSSSRSTRSSKTTSTQKGTNSPGTKNKPSKQGKGSDSKPNSSGNESGKGRPDSRGKGPRQQKNPGHSPEPNDRPRSDPKPRTQPTSPKHRPNW